MSASRFRRFCPFLLIPLAAVLAGAYLTLKQPAHHPYMAVKSAQSLPDIYDLSARYCVFVAGFIVAAFLRQQRDFVG